MKYIWITHLHPPAHLCLRMWPPGVRERGGRSSAHGDPAAPKPTQTPPIPSPHSQPLRTGIANLARILPRTSSASKQNSKGTAVVLPRNDRFLHQKLPAPLLGAFTGSSRPFPSALAEGIAELEREKGRQGAGAAFITALQPFAPQSRARAELSTVHTALRVRC